MLDLTKPVDASYELNNICNLMCPQCARNTIKDGVLQKNPGASGNPLPTLDNYQMSLDDFKTSFDNIGNVGLVKFYGTVSENVASSNFYEISQYIIENGARILLSTNGSLRSKEWWSELGKLYSKSAGSRVVFCLDGLHDALPLYRINANYDKIIENAIAFIGAGGQAEWRMIIFKHNQHQLEDAQKLAKQYGFHKFTYQYSNRMDVEPFTYKGKEYNLEPQDLWPEWEDIKKDRYENREVENIICKFQVVNSIYIDYLCRVWPCCYLPSSKHLLGDQKFYDDYYHDTSNNLLEKNLEEIMNDVFYDVLQLSWEDKSTCLKPCSNTCSFSKDATRESARTSNYRVDVW